MTLGIVQARLESSRLPRKMLLPVQGKPLLWHGWRQAVLAFGPENVVIACPVADITPLYQAVPDATWFAYEGHDWDVLGRFHSCAHAHRTYPEALIARITPDDWPIHPYREVFPVKQLDAAQTRIAPDDRPAREHILYTLFPETLPSSIDTDADYQALLRNLPNV